MEFSCKPTKIEVRKDGKKVDYGGEGLGLNQRINYWFIDEGMISEDL